jgi:aminocarboxymuconate-semialdehyde decarboxylase
MKDLGLKGVEIGTNVNGRNLDDPEFLPFFERAAALNAFIFVHPVNTAGRDRMGRYYLTNLIGNPVDSGVAIASMIFGGVFERCPDLHCCFAHGGGIAPYILGRWEHGYRVRPEAADAVPKPPSAYFKQIYCDSLAHSHAAVRYLVDLLGPEHVVLGCDYPYDMGDEDPVGSIESNPLLNDSEKQAILEENVPRLLGLSDKVST